jgi:hypothetical protein
LQPNIAIVIVAADSRSNRGSDGVLAFQQKAKEASVCSSMLEWLLAPTHKTDFMTFRTHSSAIDKWKRVRHNLPPTKLDGSNGGAKIPTCFETERRIRDGASERMANRP